MKRAPAGPQPTTEQLETLALTRNGADVFSRTAAVRLRELARGFPTFVRIRPPRGNYPSTHEQPIFHAAATFEGLKAAARAGISE